MGFGQRRYLELALPVLGISCLLLLFLLGAFTVHNFKREKIHIETALRQKATTLMQFINSSVRESMRRSFGESRAVGYWQDHVLRALELAVEQPGVMVVSVVDKKGETLFEVEGEGYRHFNGKSRLNTLLERLDESSERVASYLYEDPQTQEKVYLFAARHGLPAKVTRHKMGHGDGHHRKHMKRLQQYSIDIMQTRPIIVVELDYSRYAGPLKRQFLQILLQLLLIILVAVGGLLSFAAMRRMRGMEKDLGNVRAFTESMLTSLSVGIMATDSRGQVLICNDQAERLLALAKVDPGGLQTEDYLPPSARKLMGALDHDSLNKIEQEVELTLKSGQQLQIYAVAQRVYHGKSSLGKVLVLHDISRVKELERDLQRNERDAALGKMTATVAHELRNPLSSIKGLALLFGKKGDIQLQKEARESLLGEVERLGRSIDALLDYTKPEQLHLEKVCLKELLDSAVGLVRLDLDAKKIAIEKQYDQELVALKADGERLRRVFLNLLVNAVQAIGEKEDGRIMVTIVQEGNTQIVRICDNGPGINESLAERIMQPYFTTKEDGVGLGLSLSKKIVEEHGGRLEFSRDNNQWTVFAVILSSP